METRKIGVLDVTVIGVGCNGFGRDLDEVQVDGVVGAALDEGITYFDTADIYGHPGSKSERFLGSALAKRRDEAVIATKFGHRIDRFEIASAFGGARPENVRSSVEGSLTRLGTDRIDLFQLHHYDPETPIADTLGALAELVHEGKIREIGCTNFSLAQLQEVAATSGPSQPGFASTQNQYNLIDRSVELDILPECKSTGLALVTSRPLYFGMLGGRYKRGETPGSGTRLSSDWYASERDEAMSDAHFDVVEGLTAFAASHGHTIADLAFAWLLAHVGVATVIAGVSSPSQVAKNARAASWVLTKNDLAQIDLIAPRA